ncbi:MULTISPECIES: hypothetical protein [unclassified Gilliamella]|uniref:hypothetical protein n=1 Tax=unclassified Gilliamella TaxID=2685620 RepID=UPI00130B9D35|nr:MULTISPECIES: hypothetical protein [unclassified Gilliamella]MWP48220.1 hypothetical protein [Gilliamella sp. Lep-s35]MWP68140.1 hypothetical protein [Gilliamella sp. Lep-s5]MWP76360.1 hypothetical protein [Gilliamella sp. Lep-s21]
MILEFEDIGIDDRRYDMSIWMIKNNWFQRKTKNDIVEQLPKRNTYKTTITNNKITYCVKEIRGWNIDSESRPLAYLDLYFKDDLVIKVVLRERKQTFLDKIESLDGFPIISEQEYKKKLVWNEK